MDKKALIIGIDEYRNSPLSGCVKDADEIAKLLSTNYDGTPNFDVRPLYNVESKSELRGHIKSLFEGTHDVSLLYFAGHGYFEETGGYLVTPDYVENDMGINMNEIMTMASKSNSKDRVLILDCCHSGLLGSMSIAEETTMLRDGMTIMAACDKKESAVELNGHGIFTNLLISGLKGGASDLLGNVSPGGLYSYIDRSLGAWDQRPIFKTNVSRFSPIRKTVPPISRETIISIGEIFESPDTEVKLDPSFEYTNNPTYENMLRKPYTKDENVEKFKKLQQLESVGLVIPVDEEHMYFAAMNSKSCKLTPLGKHYYSLVNNRRV